MADLRVSVPSRESGTLGAGQLVADLQARTARGGAVIVAAQVAKQAITFLVTMVLARVLTPSDYGLLAMVNAVIALLTVFRDLGLSLGVVQREVITQEQASALFWANAGVGLLLTGITMGLSPFIAGFYREPRLAPVTCAMAPMFLLSGLAAQQQAWLLRQMRFGALAIVDVAVLIVNALVGIVLALAGKGYWSLILNIVAGQLVWTAALWAICRWRPGRPRRATGIRSLLGLGGNLVGFNLAHYLARNLDSVLIGRAWGEGQLGLYDRAYKLFSLPVVTISTPIAAVAVPALSRLQDAPKEYRRLYLQIISAIAFVTMPIAALMIVESQDLIRVVLGERWTEATAVFRLLGISALLQPLYSTQGWLQASLGRTDRLRWGLVSSALIVASFFLGLPYGAKGVALAYSCTIVIITWPCQRYALRGTLITLRDVLGAIGGPAVFSLLAGGMALLTVQRIGFTGAAARLVITALLLSLAYAGMHCLLPGSRQQMISHVRWLCQRFRAEAFVQREESESGCTHGQHR